MNVSREITFLEEVELIRASANPNTLLHLDDETIEIDESIINTSQVNIYNRTINYINNSTPQHNYYNCWYTNATSIVGKFSELLLIIEENDIDLLMISKTWYNDISSVQIPGYNSFFKHRKSHGGGVCIYVKIGRAHV